MGEMNICQNFMAIYPIFVEIFQSGHWINIAISRTVLLTSLKCPLNLSAILVFVFCCEHQYTTGFTYCRHLHSVMQPYSLK